MLFDHGCIDTILRIDKISRAGEMDYLQMVLLLHERPTEGCPIEDHHHSPFSSPRRLGLQPSHKSFHSLARHLHLFLRGYNMFAAIIKISLPCNGNAAYDVFVQVVAGLPSSLMCPDNEGRNGR